jgi:GTP-binding protein
MRFVDEAKIRVEAGKGGNGHLSFRREKFVPRGGPDGGDGGDGGSIYLQVNGGLNTLADFRHSRLYRAQHGQRGMGSEKTGGKGEDLIIQVPLGTIIIDEVTNEIMGDLVKEGQQVMVARGGFHGLGNLRYKSSTNRAPRQTSKGTPGESRNLRLEMQVLADVGLLGMPNAGKSTFISKVTAARPKIADYPFTTLYPQLGVVRISNNKEFIIADIPGLIEGAAEGAGLGINFLKHLSRTHLLLHFLEYSPYKSVDELLKEQNVLENELRSYDKKLYEQPRWLVINKIDLMDSEAQSQFVSDVTESLQRTGPVFYLSAVTGQGCDNLIKEIQTWINNKDGLLDEDYQDE